MDVGANPWGLDWAWNSSSHTVRLRAYGLTLDSTASVRVAQATRVPIGGFCPRVNVELRRAIDGALYSTMLYGHTSGSSGTYTIYANSGWYPNDIFIGSMVQPGSPTDQCNTEGWHTMQSAVNGGLPYHFVRNSTGFPGELSCNWFPDQCPLYYNPWGSPYEYLIKFFGY